MAYSLDFSHLIEYDAGLLGITFEISLNFGGSSTTVLTKIDTGSSECVFTRRVAEKIGIEAESGEEIRISTATGTFIAYRHPVLLFVKDYVFDIYAYFAADENFNRNVLGRHGFLDRIVLGLVDYEGKLFLNRY